MTTRYARKYGGAAAEESDRNFLIWALSEAAGVSDADLGRMFKLSRNRIGQVCKRFERKIESRINSPWLGIDIDHPPAWMARLEAAGAIPRHPGMTKVERWNDSVHRLLSDRQRAARFVRGVIHSVKFGPSPPQWRQVVPSADDGTTITRQYHAVKPAYEYSPKSGPWFDRDLEYRWHTFLLGWWLVGELHVRITNAADVTIAFGAKTCRDEGQRLIDRAEFFERELVRRKEISP
jgi:hypothetical protein